MTPLSNGIYVQYYRDAQRGDDAAALDRAITSWDEAVGSLIKGVAMHSVNMEMDESEYAKLAEVCHKRNLLSLAVFGLGDSHPQQYGRMVGTFANRPDCAAAGFDCEGSYENEPDDPQKAQALCDATRQTAPDAYLFDQPWAVPTQHHRFPDEIFARTVNIRCSQDYFESHKKTYGRLRYAKCLPWFTASQADLDARLAAKGIHTPRGSTLQGYGWTDVIHDLVDALMRRADSVTFIWSDPLPTKAIVVAMRAVARMRALGFRGADGVRGYQASLRGVIVVDGKCGRKTLRALGFTGPVLDDASILPMGA
jgi:hypothetical protein